MFTRIIFMGRGEISWRGIPKSGAIKGELYCCEACSQIVRINETDKFYNCSNCGNSGIIIEELRDVLAKGRDYRS